MRIVRYALVVALLLVLGHDAFAQSLPAVTVSQLGNGQQTYSLSIQVLALMTALTVLPALLLSMTAFTRIVIVLAILRQALGTPQTPPNQVLIGLSLFLTFFVMSPVFTRAYDEAVVPYMAGEQDAMTAAKNAIVPLRGFMMDQVRENDLKLFVDLSGHEPYAGPEEVPLAVRDPELHHERAENRVSDRLPDLHSVPDHRSRRRERADVDGHDDALADADLAAVQDHVVRARRRLVAARRHVGVELLCLR